MIDIVRVVNMHEAKTQLSRLVQEVLDGGEVVIARANEPVARLVALEKPRRVRRLGEARGLIEIAADFDEPLEDFESLVGSS